MKRLAFLLLLMASGGGTCLQAQTPADSIRTATLTVTGDTVSVVLDTLLLGQSPLHELPIDIGHHTLKFLPVSAKLWFTPIFAETLLVHPHDRIVRRAGAKLIHVTSDPFGAQIYWQDSLLGTTPYIGSLPDAGTGLTLRKGGYRDAVVFLSPRGEEYHARLEPLVPGQEQAYLTDGQANHTLPLYVATGVTVLSGAAAAYFKIKADGFYDDYRQTGSTGPLDQVHRYDLLSGVSLAVSEAGFLALTYLIFNR